MKKIILFFLIGMMSMAMMGCSGEKNQMASANKQNETIEKETSVNTGSGKLLGGGDGAAGSSGIYEENSRFNRSRS